MSLLLETIRIQNKTICNLPAHSERMHRSRRLLLKQNNSLDIAATLQPHLKELDPRLTYKCRLFYQESIQDIEIIPYSIRPVNSLKIVVDDSIAYAHKYANRDSIKTLLHQRGNCDDVLIIQSSYITDTSYCNVLFSDGSKWFTPATPLLKGTMRQQLLKNGQIEQALLKVNDLHLFKKVKLINAMMNMKEAPSFSIENIQI